MRLYVTTIGYFSKKAWLATFYFLSPRLKLHIRSFCLRLNMWIFTPRKESTGDFQGTIVVCLQQGNDSTWDSCRFGFPFFFWVRHGKALFFGCVFDFVWQEKRAKKNSSSFSLYVSCGSPTVAWWALKLQEKMPPPRLGVWGFGDSMNI